MSKYDDALPRIEQALGDYATMLEKEVNVSDVIHESEQLALTKRGKFPTIFSVLRDGKRIIREK